MDQGVKHTCESANGKTDKRIEIEYKVQGNIICSSDLLRVNEQEDVCSVSKDGELRLSGVRPGKTQVEARNGLDMQIVHRA